MRIGIDIRPLMDIQYSGVAEYELNLLNEIFSIDFKNEYRLFYNSAFDISSRMSDFNYPNVKIIKLNYPNKVFNYLMQKTLNYPKIDKLLGIDFFWMPHINFISLSKECKSALTIHDLSFLHYPDFFNFRKNLWHYIINVKKLIKKTDNIIAVSENTRNDIMDLCGVEKDKISVIYSGVGKKYRIINNSDLEYLNLQKVREKYGLFNKFFLYLGTLEPRKNVGGIIQAFDLFCKNRFSDDYILVIAGGNGWKNKDISASYKKAKYKERIKFLGYVSDKDKIILYNLASIFLYPSFYEGFGLPVLEAMRSGVPVITSNISSLPEVAGNSAFMIDPYNINEIAVAMEKIESSMDFKNRLIESGKNQFKKFLWSRAAREYLDIFNR